MCSSHCIYSGIHFLYRTGIQSQWNFNVLDEILRKWKDFLSHGTRSASSTEICNLIKLVNRRAGLCCDVSIAGNKTPCIKLSSVFDFNVTSAFHLNITVVPDTSSLLASGCSKISAAYAYSSFYCNGRAFTHCQCSESF